MILQDYKDNLKTTQKLQNLEKLKLTSNHWQIYLTHRSRFQQLRNESECTDDCQLRKMWLQSLPEKLLSDTLHNSIPRIPSSIRSVTCKLLDGTIYTIDDLIEATSVMSEHNKTTEDILQTSGFPVAASLNTMSTRWNGKGGKNGKKGKGGKKGGKGSNKGGKNNNGLSISKGGIDKKKSFGTPKYKVPFKAWSDNLRRSVAAGQNGVDDQQLPRLCNNCTSADHYLTNCPELPQFLRECATGNKNFDESTVMSFPHNRHVDPPRVNRSFRRYVDPAGGIADSRRNHQFNYSQRTSQGSQLYNDQQRIVNMLEQCGRAWAEQTGRSTQEETRTLPPPPPTHP
jgi:hypothetical protein